MKRVLIAGATGYLGRYVVKALKEHGYYTKVLIRNEQKLDQPGEMNEPSIKQYIDEIAIADVTDTYSLKGICKNIDYVFSSVGITKRSGGLTFTDVDYRGNLNLLKEAEQQNVEKFMYIHVLMNEDWKHLGPLLNAKQQFVRELANSPVNHLIIRPTGFYSDMVQFLSMAEKGRAYLIGDGKARMNPIHGADLARFCVQNFSKENATLDIGGPEVLTYNEITSYAFEALKKKEKSLHLPLFLLKPFLIATKMTSYYHYGLLQFITHVMTSDLVAPTYGKIHLSSFFEQYATQKIK